MEQNIQTIIKGALQKEPLAQKQLYQYCYTPMYKVVQRYINQSDKWSIIYNDAMLKVFGNLEKYSENGKFLGWVKQIVVNTCIDYIRVKANMRSTDTIDEYTYDQLTTPSTVIANADAQYIFESINKLPTKLAVVFNLYVYEEYDHNEIANILQIPSGTSRYYFSEAKKQLKQMLENNIFSLNKKVN